MKYFYSLIHDPHLSYHHNIFDNRNPVYKAVENLLYKLGLDAENFNRKIWNPLSEIIKPGDKVVIKPNFVSARDREHELNDEELESTSTSPLVLKPIIDYVWKALKGKGKISIVDSPLEGTDFQNILNRLKFNNLIEKLQDEGINIELIDLRDFIFARKMICDDVHFKDYSINLGLLIKKNINGDPLGYRIIDLKKKSFFCSNKIDFKTLRFHRSNPTIPVKHHSNYHNEYSISKTVLDSNVFINVPKLKTHKKAGVTLNLKSLIGITNRKHWLPHYRQGTPPLGDEYPTKLPLKELLHQKLSRFPLPLGHSLIFNIIDIKNKKKIITEGEWSGNDTLWRVILDLNKILFYADKKGSIQNTIQRKYLSIIDGIRGGEGDGPLRPKPKKSGVLIAGFNPIVIDALAVNIMGFDHHKIKQISQALPPLALEEKELDKIIGDFHNNYNINLKFQPPFGWESIVRV